MRRTSTIAPVLIAIAVATTSIALGQEPSDSCAPRGLVPQLMTPAADYVPQGAALVVGLFPGGSDTSGALPPIALTRRRRTVALRSEPIAPGLFRLVPETERLRGRYEVSGLSAARQLHFRRGTLPPAPAAPRLERVERYLVASGGERRLEVRAHFAFPLPTDIVAVVSAWGDDDDEPDAFVRSSPTQRSLVLFTTRGECEPALEGASAPPQTGGTVRVALVDRHGQVSPLSEAHSIE